MEPTVRLGDRVRVQAADRIRAGDVVLFAGARGHVLHRVVLALPGLPWFVHLGDAGSEDGPGVARKSAIIGRAALPRRQPSLGARLAGLERLGRAARRARDRH